MDMIKNSARMKSIDAASSSEHLSVAILLITHSGIGYEMMNVVFTTFSEKAPTLNIHHLPIQPEQDPDDMIHQAKQLIKTIDTGAGVLILVSEKILKQFNLTPLARFSSFAVRGVAPEIMGIGPKEAIPAALRAAGITQDQLDWIELNEAFAAQALAVIGDLGLDPAKVNPMGGAIALGHPLGATGAIRAATTIHAMRRKNLKYGMVTMCVGTGMGAAGIFERM